MMFMTLAAHSRNALLYYARQVIRQRICQTAGEFPQPDDPALRQPAGSFVSLHQLPDHRLRGCVGRLDADVPLWESVGQSALLVLSDPRFSHCPIGRDDLARLTIEITVIGPMRPCTAEDFDVLCEGIYLTDGERTGCFLPQVARDTGWDRPQLLERLCVEKLRTSADAWRQPSVKFFAFLTDQIGPEPFDGDADGFIPSLAQ